MNAEESNQPDLAIIDADSILYRICWKERSPAKARRAFDDWVGGIVKDLDVPEAYVFVKGDGNFRFEVALDYKGHRTGTIEPDMKDAIERLYEHCRENYVSCDGAEADDFCSIYQYQAMAAGRYPVLCHIDKDLNMIPGLHYNYSTKKPYSVLLEDAYVFLMSQLLSGDSADNIKGLTGIGPVKAMKALEGSQNKDMLGLVQKRWAKEYPEDWQERFTKCANLIFIRPREELLRPLTTEEILSELEWAGEGRAFYPITTPLTPLLTDDKKYYE